MQGQNFNNFENDRINLSVSESQHSWVARRDHTNVTGQFCLGNDFQISPFEGWTGPRSQFSGTKANFLKPKYPYRAWSSKFQSAVEQNTSLLEHRNNQPNAAVAEIQEDILFSMAALDNEGPWQGI